MRKVSIIPRGIAALGYTLQLPTEDRYLLTKSELLDRMSVMLGGRVAEELVFGESSTGAKNDLEKATGMAISMVRTYGMSKTPGPLSYDRGRPMFLESPWSQQKDYSEETARKIDEEVKIILEEAYEKAKSVLRKELQNSKTLHQYSLIKRLSKGKTQKTS